MITLKDNRLTLDFSSHFPGAMGRVNFIRTLRLPDDGNTHYLPARLGEFALRHIEDSNDLPTHLRNKGGVMLPIYQAEAMWIDFEADYPIALKIGCGKINALSGKPWSEALLDDENDYIVIPVQPWIDGFSVAKGTVRQFVAMPLGSGMTAEEQITGEAEVGGIQIIAYPMTREAYERIQKKREEKAQSNTRFSLSTPYFCRQQMDEMGLAAGAKIAQAIYKDPYGLASWEVSLATRCFVHLVNSESWNRLTGECMPRPPITAKEYKQAGLPWFHYYSDADSLDGSTLLNKIKSIGEFGLFKQDKATDLPVDVSKPIVIESRKVSDGCF